MTQTSARELSAKIVSRVIDDILWPTENDPALDNTMRAEMEMQVTDILSSGWIETPQSSQMDTAHHDEAKTTGYLVGTGVGCTSLPSASAEERAREWLSQFHSSVHGLTDSLAALLTLTEQETRKACAKVAEAHDPEKNSNWRTRRDGW